jgi:hypothetical protein
VTASDISVVWGHAQEDWFVVVNHVARLTPWLHTPARLFAEYGVVAFAGLLLLSWLLTRRHGGPRRATAALCAPLGVLVAVGVNQFLAAAVAEPRPYRLARPLFSRLVLLLARTPVRPFVTAQPACAFR